MIEAPKFDVVHLSLYRGKLGQERIPLFGDLQLDAPPVLRIDGFVDEATLEKLVSDRGDKSPAEVKVIGDAALAMS